MAAELKAFVDKVNEAIRSEKVMRTAVSTVLAIHKPRIFEKGTDASGAKIGTYSSKPISIAKSQQARNTGQTYFPGGYAEYKSAVGKNPGYVILRNTDQMMVDYGIRQTGADFGLGFQNTENYKKSIWLQDKYDKQIFDHTDKELDVLAQVLEREIARAI